MIVKEYGYEYDAELDKDLFERTFNKNASDFIDGAYALRSGRDAKKRLLESLNRVLRFCRLCLAIR
jgi:hypothetical protein